MKRLIILLLVFFAVVNSVLAVKPPAIKTTSSQSSIDLAQHLRSSGAVKYSAYWCPHCHEQNELFGKEAASKLINIECASDGNNSQTSLCKKKGITGFPSWEINGIIESGIKSLEELAELSDYKGKKDF